MPAVENAPDDSRHEHSGEVEIALQCESWSALISTRGASLRDLSFDEHKIIEGSWPEADDWFAGSTLAPWVNRLADGAWTDDEGVKHQAPINDAKNNCANHGLVFNRVFTIESASKDQVTLSASCFDQSAYPFEVFMKVAYSLNREGLEVAIQLENRGDTTAPVAYGSHPYFVVDQKSVLQVSAETRVQVDARMLPTETSKVDGGVFEIAPADASDFTDACFTDLKVDDGMVKTRLTRPALKRVVELAQSPDFAFLQVFTLQAGFAGHDGLLALEPQTASANAFNSREGLIELAPSESKISKWSLGLRDSIHA